MSDFQSSLRPLEIPVERLEAGPKGETSVHPISVSMGHFLAFNSGTRVGGLTDLQVQSLLLLWVPSWAVQRGKTERQ